MKSKFLFIALLGMIVSPVAFSQTTETQPRELPWDQSEVAEREAIPYDYVSENDVYWHKRVWRVIDVNEKMNLPFRYEGLDWTQLHPLAVILRDAAIAGEITTYEDDNFKNPYTPDQVKQRGGGIDTIPLYDLEGEYLKDTTVEKIFDPRLVKHFRIKEDWFFNRKTSQLQVRIMGITAMYLDEASGIEIALFYVYYPNCRTLLAKSEVFNPKNDAQRWSWDDVFEMRLFSSQITKESNVFDRRIVDYAQGLDALRESERIKMDIFNFEHDLWSF